MRALVDMDALARFRNRALNPDRPVLKGTAMNPDIWFQGAETRNPQHAAVPGVLKAAYKKFEELTGRSYKPFEYYGDPNAETLLVAMGSGAEVVRETVLYLNKEQGMKLGLLQVRLYRPWSDEDFAATLPKSVKNVVVLDRTKEPGSGGEPLYLDVVAALENARRKGHIAAHPRPSSAGATASPPKTSPRPWCCPSSSTSPAPPPTSGSTASPSASTMTSPTPPCRSAKSSTPRTKACIA